MDPKFEALRIACNQKPHGARARYAAGCRCMLCRAANSRYEVAREKLRRAGEWNGLIDVGPIVDHIRKLSLQGVGYKAIAAAASCSPTTLRLYLTGQRLHIRSQLAMRILAVDAGAAAGHALISSRSTWQLLDELLEGGYTKAQLGKWIGCQTAQMRIKRGGLITADTACRVRRMYELIQQGKLRRDC